MHVGLQNCMSRAIKCMFETHNACSITNAGASAPLVQFTSGTYNFQGVEHLQMRFRAPKHAPSVPSARCEVARARAEALRAPPAHALRAQARAEARRANMLRACPAHPERMSCRRAAAGGSSGLIVRAAKHTACTRAVSGGSADTSGQLQ